MPIDVYLVDCANGSRSLWRTLSPADPAGVAGLSDLFLTRDGSAYAYTFVRFLDELHVEDGRLTTRRRPHEDYRVFRDGRVLVDRDHARLPTRRARAILAYRDT